MRGDMGELRRVAAEVGEEARRRIEESNQRLRDSELTKQE